MKKKAFKIHDGEDYWYCAETEDQAEKLHLEDNEEEIEWIEEIPESKWKEIKFHCEETEIEDMSMFDIIEESVIEMPFIIGSSIY